MADAASDLEALANQGLAIMKRELDRVAQSPGPLPDNEVTMVEKFTRVALQAWRLQGDDDPGAYTDEELQAIERGDPVPRKGRRTRR